MGHKTRLIEYTCMGTLCDEAGCEFHGETAVQGVCHTTDGELCDFDRLEREEREILESMDAMRSTGSLEEYVATLEAHYMGAQLNWALVLDECIRLRRDNALLRKRLSKLEP